MPDIELRFGHDMLVLSAPIDATLARQGIDVPRDRQYLNLLEPDSIFDALQLEVIAGAQCIVTTTEDITRARLAHIRMDGDAVRLAQSAARIANELKPQHVLAEIGPTGLPLDTSSKASLNESRSQYADAARSFDGCTFDAFFLNRFGSIADLKCALMGIAQVSGKPVFASMSIGTTPLSVEAIGVADASAQGSLSDSRIETMFSVAYEPVDGPIAPAVPVPNALLDPAQWPEAISAMVDLGASVVGFETADPLDKALEYAQVAVAQTDLPVLAQLHVGPATDDRTRALTPLDSRTDYALETMENAARKLHAAGVQFLRATGAVTPAYTGALAATVAGLDVRARQ